MLDLSSNKLDVLGAISALSPNGNTHIPSGLVWGWNMLTSAAPLTASLPADEIAAKGGKKALVLMTDGANSSSPYDDGNYGAHADTKYRDGVYTDNLTAKLCNNIKAEGTIIYTVLFDVTNIKVENMLRKCATSPGNSFVANDAASLIAAFDQIGVSLTQLRLTK